MPRPCLVCTHPDRAELDRALVRGEPNRRIAARCDASETSVRRHRAEHLPTLVAAAAEDARGRAIIEAIDVVQEIRDVLLDARARASQAGDAGRFAGYAAIQAVRLRAAELFLEVEGRLDRNPHTNVLVLVREVLADLPAEARAIVAERLDAITTERGELQPWTSGENSPDASLSSPEQRLSECQGGPSQTLTGPRNL